MRAIKKALRQIFVFFWRKKAEPTYEVVTVKKPRKKREKFDWTLGELLDRLDEEHKRFKLKRDSWSTITKRDRKALQRMGPFIMPKMRLNKAFGEGETPDEFSVRVGSAQERIVGMSPPPQIYIGFYDDEKLGKSVKKDLCPIISMFALRQDNDPVCGLQKTPGERYMVGYSWGFSKSEEIYVSAYATIDFKTGAVCIPKMLMKNSVKLPRAKNTLAKRQRSCDGYVQKKYEMPNSWWLSNHSTPMSDKEKEAEEMLIAAVSVMFSMWHGRDHMYQVSSRKNKGRVTFCVEPGAQVRFFRDRDKTAIARDGKRKRIVHYVRSHDRVTETKTTTVKEHLRGIRKFLWNGYDVSVTIPKFHIEARDFSLRPMNVDPKDYPKGELMDIAQLTSKLVDIEDNHEYKHGAH